MSAHARAQTKASAEAVSSAGHSLRSASGLLQRKCACGAKSGLSGDCAECSEKRLTVQRRAANMTEPAGVPSIVHDVIGSPGQPLTAGVRAAMESRFGHDFSQVRVHTDARAAESCRAVTAQAFTVGRDIAFGPGQYQPETTEGKKLLAHELAHTIQQSAGAAQGLAAAGISRPGDSSEQEAERISQSVVDGQAVAPVSSSPVHIARKRAKAGAVGKLSFDSNWTYIVYDDEVRLRYWEEGKEIAPPAATAAAPADKEKSAAAAQPAKPKKTPSTEIGSIPWVTNNPGNLTVDPEADPNRPTIKGTDKASREAAAVQQQKRQSLQGLAYQNKALSAYQGRYAVFPNFLAGHEAILPYLKGIAAKGLNPDITVEQALKTYKGQEKSEGPEVKQKYVDNIKKSMRAQGLSEELVNGLMNKKIKDVQATDEGVMNMLINLETHEGLLTFGTDNVIFKCNEEFGELDLEQFKGKKKGLVTQLKNSEAAKKQLRGLLGCE